jgi:hypothetical protein
MWLGSLREPRPRFVVVPNLEFLKPFKLHNYRIDLNAAALNKYYLITRMEIQTMCSSVCICSELRISISRRFKCVI